MKQIVLTVLAVIAMAATCFAAAPPKSEPITLTLPQSVIAEAISSTLPLDIDATSKTLQGTITIKSIKNLQLTDNHLACTLHLAGNQLQFVTDVAGHEIRLKVGSVEINFDADSELRFDRKQQTLFVKPIVKEVNSTKDASSDIGHALVSLLNAKEFPVNMQDLDPIVARTGAKTLTITTRIDDIKASKEQLQLFLAPKITAN